VSQHNVAIEDSIDEVLSAYQFYYGVDLGCGKGDLGPILKNHVGWLVGVDDHMAFLLAARNKGYDELVVADVRNYRLPLEADSFFMFELLEHLSIEDGKKIVDETKPHFLLVSTPSQFHPNIEQDPHISLWSPDDFYSLGFNDVWLVPNPNSPMGDTILAVREASR